MIMGLLLPDAREIAVATETTREPRGIGRPSLMYASTPLSTKRTDCARLKSILDEVAGPHVNALFDRLTTPARARD
jgi:hypothetical protein